MTYQHIELNGNKIDLPVGKVVCIGRNYLDHVKELNNAIPEQMVLFIKPTTALVKLAGEIAIPTGNCHNELEVAVLIKQQLSKANKNQAKAAIWGLGLGLDLTLRDIQNDLKAKGQPWERAKAFDGSCPLSRFITNDQFNDLTDINFTLCVNGEIRQVGNTANMMNSILDVLVEISNVFTLMPGDVVMTGTPKGVAALKNGDVLEVTLDGGLTEQATINQR